MPIDRTRAIELHRKAKGKIKIYPTINIHNEDEMALAYIPGSVPPALAIQQDEGMSFEYTGRGNRIAVVTDGSAVLGLGNVGPYAALPVIEGKCLLFKLFGDVNAYPLCVGSQDTEDILHFCALLAPTLGGINIEDISSPKAFTIVRELRNRINVPVLCDDQHGTAVIVLAGVYNALEVQGRKLEDMRIVINGAGSAGIATAELLLKAGAEDIVVLNSSGILSEGNPRMNNIQEELAEITNPGKISGGLDKAMEGADIFIGLSKGGALPPEYIRLMSGDPIILAMALPEPEILPEEAIAAGASIVATGGPGYQNAMPNSLSTPGIMRGLLDVRATVLNHAMLLAAARALADVVDRRRLGPGKIMPDIFCDETAPRVAEAVGQAAIAEGFATREVPKGEIYNNLWQNLYGEQITRF
ncbi:MAG TPA: malic enzyme-like NAD(P)-binding protein [Synergistales bacterium]|nr:malic enzyme-like NAD(P)-binding protein [Synergistales bacterium]HPC75324.1 malic enzyme-like NAD(P)-binding protein [Synergistales bacterium]HRS48239.1 malic enzyme-like NAD(P)-binding protein [Thermovirgaceae bacterium]HRU90567.1 malic enzyme-like NAD(P)-binding protein [Thermovirgaceae bacterium]